MYNFYNHFLLLFFPMPLVICQRLLTKHIKFRPTLKEPKNVDSKSSICQKSNTNVKIVSEYDQIPQSQTAHKPMAQLGRATQQPQDTRKTN